MPKLKIFTSRPHDHIRKMNEVVTSVLVKTEIDTVRVSTSSRFNNSPYGSTLTHDGIIAGQTFSRRVKLIEPMTYLVSGASQFRPVIIMNAAKILYEVARSFPVVL